MSKAMKVIVKASDEETEIAEREFNPLLHDRPAKKVAKKAVKKVTKRAAKKPSKRSPKKRVSKKRTVKKGG